jgi:hypothetical protein
VHVKLLADVAAAEHLIEELSVRRQQLHDEIDNIQTARRHGRDALRCDELKNRLQRKSRKGLKIGFRAQSTVRCVFSRHVRSLTGNDQSDVSGPGS